MVYIIFIAIISILLYSVIKYPGLYLAYILLFQSFNQSIFQELGLSAFRYSTFILLFPLFLLINYKKFRLPSQLGLFFSNKMTIGYFLITIYIVAYGLYLGTNYEFSYINSFLMPGVILFSIGGLFIYDESIVKQLFFGILIFAVLNFLFIEIVWGVSFIASIERRLLSDYLTMGVIWQARIAGLGILFSILLFISKKGLLRYFSVALLISFVFWISLTGTRGPVVSIFIALLFLFLFANTKFKLIGLSYSSVLLLAIGFIIINIGITETVLFERLPGIFDVDQIQSMKRYDRYFLFIDILPDHFLFGLGPGGWGKYVMIGDYRYPHNIIMEFMIEFGVVGTISFLLIFLSGFSTTLRIIKNNSNNVYLLAMALGWVYFASNSMFSGSFISGTGTFFVYTGILVGLSSLNKLQNATTELNNRVR